MAIRCSKCSGNVYVMPDKYICKKCGFKFYYEGYKVIEVEEQ